MKTRYFAIMAVLAVLAIAGGAYGVANDNEVGSCPPGSHFKVTEPNGDELVIRRDIRDLPEGSYIQAGQIKVYRDGTVEGKGEVTCIEPA